MTSHRVRRSARKLVRAVSGELTILSFSYLKTASPGPCVHGPAELALHVVQSHDEGPVLHHVHEAGDGDLSCRLLQLLCHCSTPPGAGILARAAA